MVVESTQKTISAEDFELIERYASDYAAIGDGFIEYKIPLEDLRSIDGMYTDVNTHMLDKDDDELLIYGISDTMETVARISDSGGGYSD